jgi:hypothetical protein
MITAHPKQLKPKVSMAPVKCHCGIVLGWTDGTIFVVGTVSFSKVVTGKCAGCGNHKTWRPEKVKAA